MKVSRRSSVAIVVFGLAAGIGMIAFSTLGGSGSPVVAASAVREATPATTSAKPSIATATTSPKVPASTYPDYLTVSGRPDSQSTSASGADLQTAAGPSNAFPWELPSIAERIDAASRLAEAEKAAQQKLDDERARAVEAERIAASQLPAAAVAPTITVIPPTTIVSPPTAALAPPTTTSVAATAPIPVNNTAVFAGRGTVGYLGALGALVVVDSAATAPAGTTWDPNRSVLNVQAAGVILDHLYVKGGVDVYGGGTTTITNSLIEFGAGDELGVLMRGTSGVLVMSDTTIRRLPGSTQTVGSGRGVVQISGGHSMTLLRNDLSGLPDGMQLAGDNLNIAWNWIHDLSMVGVYPNNTHNDGVQLYSGTNINFSNNRIEIGAVSPYSNGALFFQGSGIGAVRIESNYLDGGGYSIRLETGSVSVINNVVGPNHLWGNKFVGVGATVVDWRDNLDLGTGGAVTPP